MVTWSWIRGCFSEPRGDFSVMKGWQQVMHAVRWIKQFSKKSQQSLSHLSKRDGSLTHCNVTQHGIDVVTG